MLVNHHKKSESMKVHLNKCAPFRNLMNGMEEDKCPTWYTANKKPMKPLSTAVSSLTSSVAPSSSRQRSIKELAIPVVNKQQKVQFQKHIAMHYYTTGSSFQQVEDVHLIAAIKTLRLNDGLLPNRRQLATSLLDAYHEDVKTKVTEGMIGATSYLISDGVATPLWAKCEDETHTPKSGNLESSGTPEKSELDCRGQNTSPWGLLYTVGKVLKCRCPKWPCMSHLDICSLSYEQKKGRELNWQFDSRPLKVENQPDSDVCRKSATWRWKVLKESYKIASELIPIRGLSKMLWMSKVPGA